MALDIVALEDVIEKSGMKRGAIAKDLQMSASQFSQKANGSRRFTIEEALKMADLFDLSLADFKKLWKGN